MSDTLFPILFVLSFCLGWVIRGLKAMRDEQDVTHELFRRAADHEAKALQTHGREGYVELGKARACIDSASLVAGIEVIVEAAPATQDSRSRTHSAAWPRATRG